MTRALRRNRRITTSAFLLAVVTVSGGCSRAQPTLDLAATGGSPSPSLVESPASSATEPTEQRTERATPEPDAPEPGSMDRPGASSGPLSQDDFPRPGSLGPDWAYSVDPGDAEEGYAGNGTPALARDPGEVVRLAVPLGCARPRAMPLPGHALEVDYDAGGTKVIAIRGEFRDVGVAEQFFAARTDNLRRCVGRSGGQALGPLVSTVDEIADDVLLSDRTPESAPWAELALLDGDQVVLVAAQGRIGAPPMTRQQARRLAEVFRG